MGSIGREYYTAKQLSFRQYPPDLVSSQSGARSKQSYKIISADDQLRFEQWVLGMRDGWQVTGMGSCGSLSWLYNASRTYCPGRPWITLIAFGREDNRILGTASFVKSKEDTAVFGVLDFVVVSLELRGHGIGSLLCAEIDAHIQREVTKKGSQQVVHLETSNEGARRIYVRLGFEPDGKSVSVPGVGVYHALAKTYERV